MRWIFTALLLSICFSALAAPTLEETITQAKKGDAESQSSLAEKYRMGEGVETNLDKTIAWHEKAAKNGNEHSEHMLGVIYLTADVTKRDLAKSFAHLKAAQRKSPEIPATLLNLLTFYELEPGKDLTQSKADYEKAAEKGDKEAQYQLGLMYHLGIEGEYNVDKALNYFNKIDKPVAPKVNRALGTLYREKASEMMFNDPKLSTWEKMAKDAFVKAAEQGDVSSELVVAQLYLRSESGESLSMPESFNKGVELLEKVANKGVASAQLQLGMLYFNGDKLSEDKQKAKYWLEKAALQGDPNAQQAMGVIYFLGRGVPLDYTEAAKWYEKAAVQGGDNSMVALGRMYAAGLGVQRDVRRASFLFNKACDMGNREGCMMAGRNRVGY